MATKLKFIVFDIETLNCMMLFTFFDRQTKEWQEFEISIYRNNLHAFVKYYQSIPDDILMVSYNGLNFDNQVLEYVVRSYDKWFDKTVPEIIALIRQFVDDLIDDRNHGLRLPYFEDSLTTRPCDLMKIHHYDNENRQVSLKWLEFMMDSPNIEEMPYDFRIPFVTEEQAQEIRDYCRNDIIETNRFLDYTLGEVEHEIYKGQNMIQDRLDLIEEGLLPETALNYANSKIGDELNKRTYCKLANKQPKELYDLKRARKPTKKFTFGDCIPDYVQFQTPEFQRFFNEVKGIKVSLADAQDQEFKFKYNKGIYTIAKGGIHSNEKNRILIPGEDEYLEDADVGAQYTNSIRKRRLYPKHLGPRWNDVCVSNIERKDYFKQAGKQSTDDMTKRKYKGLETMYKYALNGGLFGKTLERTNWQYAPEVGFYCTIGNQFEILMLIEKLEMAGIQCVSANTDGIVCLYKKDMEATYYEICHWWEDVVGYTDQGKLEYTRFSALYQEAVNCYVAIKSDGKLKVKGRFAWENELHKNNTKDIPRISREAIIQYFWRKIPVEKTIMESRNLYMFGIGLKGSRNYHYRTINLKTGIITRHEKVIRFYVSKDGEKLIKTKTEGSEARGAQETVMLQGNPVIIFNKFVEKPWTDYNIDFDYYINVAKDVIRKIERGAAKKLTGRKQTIYNPNQTTLF